MKTQSKVLNTLSKEQLKELTNQVKETLAEGFISTKTFTAVDLWNIHRRRKTISVR